MPSFHAFLRARALIALAGSVSLAGLTAAACGDSGSDVGGQGGASGGATSDGGAGATGGEPTQGGGGEGGEGGGGLVIVCGEPTEVSFSADLQPIFTGTCALTGCHTGTLPDAGLDLSEGEAYAELVGVETSQCNHDKVRVVVGDPASSYLMQKLLGVEMCGTSRKMPKRAPLGETALPFGDAQIQVIQDWICKGALDD